MMASRAVGLFDSGPLRLLPSALREPRRAWLAILIGAALTLAGSLALSALAASVAPTLGKPEFPMKGPAAFLLLFAFAPLVETLIMAAMLSMLVRFMSPTLAVLVSAALWGIAHSLQAAAWGLVIWWPFVIFSTLYMVWRERSVVAALGVATATHALQNLLPALKIAFG
jgi:hypothetical protein